MIDAEVSDGARQLPARLAISFIPLIVVVNRVAIERKRVLEQACRLSQLSVRLSVCRSVCPVGELWKKTAAK